MNVYIREKNNNNNIQIDLDILKKKKTINNSK